MHGVGEGENPKDMTQANITPRCALTCTAVYTCQFITSRPEAYVKMSSLSPSSEAFLTGNRCEVVPMTQLISTPLGREGKFNYMMVANSLGG